MTILADITPAHAAEVLESTLHRWQSLIGVACETRDDGEPVLVVTLTKVDVRTAGRLPRSFLGYEVRPRLFWVGGYR